MPNLAENEIETAINAALLEGDRLTFGWGCDVSVFGGGNVVIDGTFTPKQWAAVSAQIAKRLEES